MPGVLFVGSHDHRHASPREQHGALVESLVQVGKRTSRSKDLVAACQARTLFSERPVSLIDPARSTDRQSSCGPAAVGRLRGSQARIPRTHWWRLQRTRREESAIINGCLRARQLFDSLLIGGALRYAAAAERAWNCALTNLRAAKNDRKREASHIEPDPIPQPQETEKVMAIGSVLQNDPEPSENPAPKPQTASERLRNTPALQPDRPTPASEQVQMLQQATRTDAPRVRPRRRHRPAGSKKGAAR